jgi:hypothetical protein
MDVFNLNSELILTYNLIIVPRTIHFKLYTMILQVKDKAIRELSHKEQSPIRSYIKYHNRILKPLLT